MTLDRTSPDRTGPDRIGFDRLIRLRWLDRAALMAAELREGHAQDPARALHQAMLEQLVGELPGLVARRKTANVLTRIWWRTPASDERLRDEALAQIKDCSPDERVMFHWGMCLLAYPVFQDVAAMVGRLIRLQGAFRQAQVVSRLSAEWGNRSTLEMAAPRIVRSMADWGALVAEEEKGVYRAGARLDVRSVGPGAWLPAVMSSCGSAEMRVADLWQAPELFPIAIERSAAKP